MRKERNESTAWLFVENHLKKVADHLSEFRIRFTQNMLSVISGAPYKCSFPYGWRLETYKHLVKYSNAGFTLLDLWKQVYGAARSDLFPIFNVTDKDRISRVLCKATQRLKVTTNGFFVNIDTYVCVCGLRRMGMDRRHSRATTKQHRYFIRVYSFFLSFWFHYFFE